LNPSVLIIEDDLEMANVLQQGLEQENYSVTLADNGWKGLHLAQSEPFRAIILDIMLPSLDGYSLTRQLRAGGNVTPILMLTARDSVTDLVTGFEAGAEDYLTKPFSFLELLARLRCLLRKGQPEPRSWHVSDLRMDDVSHRVSRGDQLISLTKTEYLLLRVLLQNAGYVVSRDEIVRSVWGAPNAIEHNGVDVHIRLLRAKIDQPYREKLIETVRGFGYRIRPDGTVL
jgi:two-component system, OmpR family, copper resistance phosphate regulon response regulator CusR